MGVRRVCTRSVWEYVEAVCGSTSCTYRQCVVVCTGSVCTPVRVRRDSVWGTSCTYRQCVGVRRGSVWECVQAVCGST